MVLFYVILWIFKSLCYQHEQPWHQRVNLNVKFSIYIYSTWELNSLAAASFRSWTKLSSTTVTRSPTCEVGVWCVKPTCPPTRPSAASVGPRAWWWWRASCTRWLFAVACLPKRSEVTGMWSGVLTREKSVPERGQFSGRFWMISTPSKSVNRLLCHFVPRSETSTCTGRSSATPTTSSPSAPPTWFAAGMSVWRGRTTRIHFEPSNSSTLRREERGPLNSEVVEEETSIHTVFLVQGELSLSNSPSSKEHADHLSCPGCSAGEHLQRRLTAGNTWRDRDGSGHQHQGHTGGIYGSQFPFSFWCGPLNEVKKWHFNELYLHSYVPDS